MHGLEASQDRIDYLLGLLLLKFIFCFDFIVKLTSAQKLNNDVKRVLGLENFVELHQVFVIQAPHDFYLFDQAFFPFILAVGRLL